MFTIPAPFELSDLAGFRYSIIGYSYFEGFQIVTKIVADTPEEARAELDSLLADEAYADWTELYSLPFDVWGTFDLSGKIIYQGGQQLR